MKLHAGWWLPDDDHHFTQFADLSLYQQPVLDAAMARLPSERRQLAVDVGAHVGTWTVRLAGLFRAVVAIEADPVNADCLRRNLLEREVKNVLVLDAAAGAAAGLGHLKRGSATNSGDVMVRSGDGPGPVVKIVPLDELLADLGPVDFLKLDLQGGELPALHGAPATLASRPVVVAEFWKRLGPDHRVIAWLRQHGLEPAARVRGDMIYAPAAPQETG